MNSKPPATLKRALTLPKMLLYGLGTTIGAGIYALVGELAGISGYLAPMAFLVAALLAGLTALSFAELASRYPYASGTAAYTQAGFSSKSLSTLVGLLMVLAGLVSAAALLNAFTGYFTQLLALPTAWIIIATTLLLGAFAVWGIVQAAWLTAGLTLLGIFGLILVVIVSVDALQNLPQLWPKLIPGLEPSSWGLMFAGTLLAFYAFIGFEDMVAVAEEVKDTKRTLPWAIVLTLVLTMLLYLAIMLLVVLSIPPASFAQSTAPLATLYYYHTGQNPQVIIWISLFAIIDGALIQMIMAARVLYGLSCRQQLPAWLSYVYPNTQTPLFATILVIGIVLIFALMGDLSGLAHITSFIVLMIFSLVNLALWRIKRRPNSALPGIFSTPNWLTLCAFVASVLFLLLELSRLI